MLNSSSHKHGGFVKALLHTFAFLFSLSAYAIPLHQNMNFNAILLPQTFTTSYNFEGIVALSNCSGSLIRFENSKDTDQAMVLTNGHCFEGGFIPDGEVIVNEESSRRFQLLDSSSEVVGRVNATKVLYATMTKTDISLYKINQTYGEIKSRYNIQAMTLASQAPQVLNPIEIISGFWRRGYSCAVEAFIYKLKEGEWTWDDSVRYSRPGCEVIGGTSGSPITLAGTKTVVAINNTGNENGGRCTDNNPCEVDEKGNISYQKGYSYGQETFWIYSCLNSANEIDLQKPGCQLHH